MTGLRGSTQFPALRNLILHSALIGLIVSGPLAAQTQTQSTDTSNSSTPAPSEKKSEETIELAPFQVVAEQDRGYATNRSLAGTKTNEALSELPNPITVLNREFLDDVKIENYMEAVDFAVGAQVQSTSDTGPAGGDTALTFRGFATNWQSRDGFQWYVPSDAYNVDRVEFNRGAAALLYGDSGPGGILNLVTKRAELKNKRSILVRTDEHGSLRSELDVNQQIAEKAAIRVNALYSNKESWQDIASNKQIGGALALTWALGPRAAGISLRAGTEWGEVENRYTHGLLANQYSLYTGNAPTTVNQASTALPAGTARIQNAGAVQRWTFVDEVLRNLESTSSYKILQSTIATSNAVYDNVSEDVSNRYQNWRGPDYFLNRKFHTVTVELEKSFSPNLWTILSFNLQNQHRELIAPGAYKNVRLDPNRFLPDSNGVLVANPHFDELYIEHNPAFSSRKNIVRNYRWMGLYDLNTKFMKQRFIAALSYRDEVFMRHEYREALRPDVVAGLDPTANKAQANNLVFHRFYLADGSGENIRFSLSPQSYWAQNIVRIPHQTLASGSFTAFGHYFNNRIHSNVGIRRDIWNRAQTVQTTDPVTGEQIVATDADGNYIREKGIEDDLSVDSASVGAVFDVTKWASVALNRSNSFVFNALQEYFNGEYPGEAASGASKDATLRLSPFGNKLSANVTYFETSAPVLASTIGASTQAEAEVLALLPQLSIDQFDRAGQDSYSEKSTGYEIEVIASPTKSLTFRFGYAEWKRDRQNIFPRFTALVAEMKQVAASPTQYVEAETSLNSAKTTLLANANDHYWNVATRYTFREGRLSGVSVGASAVYKNSTRYVLAGHPDLVQDSYVVGNAFIGYTNVLRGKWKYNARINVENVTNSQVQLGGYGDRYFTEPRRISFSLGTTF